LEGDIVTGNAEDQFWKIRPYTDLKLAPFESVALTPSVVAITTFQHRTSMRTLSVCRYAESSPWTTTTLPIPATVEAMAVDPQFAYLLTAQRLYRTDLFGNGESEIATIGVKSKGGSLEPFMGGVVAASRFAPLMISVSASLEVRRIMTSYTGVTCMAAIDDRLFLGVADSGVTRLIAPDGTEIRTFIGHTASVARVLRIGTEVLASAGRDAVVRVWDVRDRFPVISIGVNGVPIASIAGSEEHLIVGLHNKAVNVFDLRNAPGRAVLGVGTPDFDPVSLCYSQCNDSLAMFGAESGGYRDAAVDRNPEGRKKIFRMYRGFLGVGSR
jgi:WD40 repeat protein